ncbi:type IVB secretion system protein IcmH/DotU [Paraburkholderia sp. Cpub6]|uniref:type IVB secretion system protein IcmH/DotU n=1 Tax=Paraburkholderia sp. Cpub6 TaxID=2723094 RepID=UPI001614956A|nr:type IVB secretion system protein IcmH/DotU [Paraburkholderia sp. Cpub6]MBB5459491.1 type VI secretion system protein ImpK [Paraburkholderia sp. Cpub6]
MNTTNDRSADATRRGDATMVRPQRAVNGDPNADPNTDPNTDAGDVTRIVRPASPTSRVMPANRPSQPPGPPPLRAELGDFLSGVANPLVRAANPLLLLTVQLRHSVAPPTDVGRLREQAVAQVRSFERYAQGAGIDTQSIVAARYVLCTMLDESVNNAPWGDLSGWAQKTLLVTFHGEAYGGAKFFQILDRLSVDFSRHLDLIELMYICLALGFGGRYLVEPGGLARLADIQDDLYRRIRGLREAPAAELAPHWRGVEDRRNPVMRHVPMWVAASAAAVVLLGAFLVFFTKLNALAAPVGAQLAAIGLENTPPPQTVATPAPTAARVTLKQLLAPQEQAGQLTVDEQTDGRDTVRLAAAELFPSGGADIAPDVVSLLHRITSALNQVKGRVIVVGHTDDQPVRSLTFKDNFALSTARAQNTQQILAQGLDDPHRLEASGAGSSQPIATPADLPANRTRNRRVEILYIPEH